ncbi:SpoIIE family protein phosphatase [Streptomyces sp. NPDC007251]|uniref:SpoIIE family protein phosphatase n=1 Tax=Streptomyces sp. NPDC007251 TaxID=3154483 RepID=UPI0033D3FC20
MAAYTALCILDARRYTREHTIALTIQRHLLLPRPVTQTTAETAQLHVPSDVGGGGGFDTFALPGARTALVVGEVAGQGIHAATTLGQIRTATHCLAALDLESDELLERHTPNCRPASALTTCPEQPGPPSSPPSPPTAAATERPRRT